jgi:hypothetical protein
MLFHDKKKVTPARRLNQKQIIKIKSLFHLFSNYIISKERGYLS